MSIHTPLYPLLRTAIAVSVIAISGCSSFTSVYNESFGSNQSEILSMSGEILGRGACRKGKKAIFGRPFVRPVAVGASAQYVYIVDAGRRALYRFNRFSDCLIELPGLPVDAATKIYVNHNSSFYLTDPVRDQVLFYDRSLKLVRVFKSLAYLSNPVALTIDRQSGNLFVADGTYNHIVVFNAIGGVMRTINLLVGKRFDGVASIADIASGPDGVYVVDRLGKEIVVLDRNGDMRYSFGKKSLKEPVAVSIDLEGLVFVADRGDNSIKVFSAGGLEFTFKGAGKALGGFFRIEDMSVNNWLLFVADGSYGKTLILSVNPDRISR